MTAHELPLILVADDEVDDLFLVEHRLHKAGVNNRIVKFRDGEELIAFLESEPARSQLKFCLLLLDLKMPLVDGLDVLAWVRKHPTLAQLPIAVVSSSPAARERDRVCAAGADEYHEKYPSAEELGGIVARASAHPFSAR